MPAFNIINGGSHAGNNLAMQEFMILPTGVATYSEALQAGSEVGPSEYFRFRIHEIRIQAPFNCAHRRRHLQRGHAHRREVGNLSIS